MKMVSLKQHFNHIAKILSNTMVNCIGALVQRRDGDTSAIWMVDIGFCNRLGFILSLVQVLSTIIT